MEKGGVLWLDHSPLGSISGSVSKGQSGSGSADISAEGSGSASREPKNSFRRDGSDGGGETADAREGIGSGSESGASNAGSDAGSKNPAPGSSEISLWQ